MKCVEIQLFTSMLDIHGRDGQLKIIDYCGRKRFGTNIKTLFIFKKKVLPLFGFTFLFDLLVSTSTLKETLIILTITIRTVEAKALQKLKADTVI